MERLTGLDASFLYMETPQVPMHIGFATVLDPSEMKGGYSFHKVMDHISDRVQRHPAFRRRLVNVPFDLHHPLWIDDAHFDVIHHVRQVALPKPGGPQEFGNMVGRIIGTPLDRSRALWEAWVIEGLRGGHVGLMVKFHHAAVDGVSGAGLLMHLFDDEPEPAPLPMPKKPEAEQIPSDLELVSFALRSRAKSPITFARVAAQTVRRLTEMAKDKVKSEDGFRGTVGPLQAPRTQFNRSVTARRNLATARFPLSEFKEIKNALEVTVNDVVIAIAGRALRKYLQKNDALPNQSLTAVVPVSVRTKEESAQMNNKVSAMWANLRTDIADPIAHAKEINKVTQRAKRDQKAMGAETLQQWAELAAPRTFNMAMRFYSRMHLADHLPPVHNLVISNVPGPRFPLYLGGARLHAIYPMGPVMEGAGLNLTVMSYLDSIDFSFLVDSELVPDVWDLAAAAEDSFKEIRRASRRHAAKAKSQPPKRRKKTRTPKNTTKSKSTRTRKPKLDRLRRQVAADHFRMKVV